MGILKVLTKGFLVTLQDQGRQMCQHLGLAEAGAMDKHAYFWANKLLGNDPQAASLEILVGDCSFKFDSSATIAITGADMDAELNDTPIENWAATKVNSGDTLSFGIMKSGLRAYLAISGGFEAPLFFNSRSTMVREHTGGLNGNKLETGDELRFQSSSNFVHQRVPARFIPDYNSELTLRFTPGYHFEEFDQESVKQCLATSYSVTNDADRMGYRLSGAKLRRDKGNILSIGVPCGAIQIPTAGEPIILLNDRQCTGGYPILGVVAARDIYQLAQRKAGDSVCFKIAEVQLLQKELTEFYQFFYRNKRFNNKDQRQDKMKFCSR